MPSRGTFASAALAIGVAACAATAAWWWLDVDRTAMYTDGRDLRADLTDHAPREVLWRAPEAVVTDTGEPIAAIDASVSPDQSVMVLSRRSTQGDTDLYVSERTEQGWSEPQPIRGLNSPDNELAPALSPDGKALYFATDRPGGSGGLDIWRSAQSETGWSEPSPVSWNSRHDDTDPHAAIDPVDGSHVVLFASDRPDTELDESVEHGEIREHEVNPLAEPPARGHAIFAARAGDPPRRLRAADVGDSLSDPALTPAADFMYWVSAPSDGSAPPALLRQRVGAGLALEASVGEQAEEPMPMDDTLASLDGIASPSLSLEGFAIYILAGQDDSPRLLRAVAREVYLSRESARGDLIRVIPWILLALAVVLLLSLLRRGVTNVRWRTTLGTLGLMARCVLASLVLHTALMALLAVLYVPEEPGAPAASSTGRVALSSSAVRNALADQLRSAERSEGQTLAAPSIQPNQIALPAPSAFEAVQLSPAQSDAPQVLRDTGSQLAEAAVSAETGMPTEHSIVAPSGTFGSVEHQARAPSPDSAARDAPSEAEIQSIRRAPSATIAAAIPAPTPGRSATVPQASMADTSPIGVAVPQQAAQIDAARVSPAGTVGSVDLLGSGAPDLSRNDLDVRLPTAQADSKDTADAVESPAAAIVPGTAAGSTVPNPVLDFAPSQVSGAPTHTESDVSLAAQEQVINDAATDPMALPTLALLPPTPTAAPALNGIALPEVLDLDFDLMGTVVDHDTGEPIAGATVRLDLAAEDDATATSQHDGTFGLTFGEIPENAAVTATMDGYEPGAINISERQVESGERVTIRLRPQDLFRIALEDDPGVHHLGDDAFTGRINSQFQRESEGLSIAFRFELTEEHARLPVRGLEFRVLAKGTQLKNPVYVNGRRIGVLDESPSDGSFGEQQLPIPGEFLTIGENIVELRSVDSPGTDHDDYEFVNPRVILVPISGGPV